MNSLMLLLPVVLPLLAGLLCLPTRSRRVLEWIHLAVFGVTSAFAWHLSCQVLRSGAIEAFNGLLRIDALGALVLDLTCFVSFVCSVYAVGFLREEERRGNLNSQLLHRYYVLTPIFVSACMAVPLVNNLGLLWVAIESSTLASVFLVRLYNHKSSLEAAWKYIIIGSSGIALALFGTVLVYFSGVPILGPEARNGFNWSALAEVADKCHPGAMRLGFIMVLVGYGTKAGLVPMHTWKPDAYAEAPVPSAALLGAGFINCAIYGIIRFYILAAKCPGSANPGNLLVFFGIASILLAAPFVLVQRNFRRLLAYSSIDHAGIMIAAVGFGTKLAALGAMLHMVFHATAKPLMFFCAGNVQQHYGTPYFRTLKGSLKTLPWTGAFLIIGALAVTGMPPFALFQSEFTILSGGAAANRTWAVALFLVGIVTIFAGFLVRMSKLLLGEPGHGARPAIEGRWNIAAMLMVAIPAMVFGFYLPAPLFELIRQAAGLIGGGQ